MLRRISPLVAITAFAAAAACLLAVTPALAHARYQSSTPGTGEVVQTSPPSVEITFTQEIQKIAGGYSLTVVKDRGSSVTAGPAVVNDTDRHKMSVPLVPDLGPGRYVVNWTDVSDEDGDPARGAFSFYIQTQPNTVDLANDAQLAQIGAEEDTTPGAGGTPATTPPAGATATTTAAPTTSVPTSAPVTSAPTGGATAAATATSTSTGGGGTNTTLIIVIVVAVAAGIGIGLGAWRVMGRRRS